LDVKSKELQITYNVNNLIRRVADLEEQKEIEKQNRNEVINIISLISFIVIIVLLIVVLHYLYLYKRSNAHLLHVTKKLKVAYGRAEIADKMKTMFIRDMNHEFRTPLNAIVGFSSVLADDTNLTGSERKKLSAIIEDNSNLLLKQLSELLDVSLMESGAIQCNYAACSLNELCSTAVDNAINKCHRGVEMSYERHDNDETLVTDGRLVLQVLLGLLDNAAKFTNEGSIRLTYTVDKARGVAAFAVTDTGPGIPADKVDAIFERFEKLDQFKSGVGMGLNLCKLISDALHGSIWLDTSYVDGARFFFEVPSENIGLKK
jgi:K+-sensing histidine kinase KdpD